MFSRRDVFLAMAALPLAASPPAFAADKPLQIVATFSVLGDFVRQVGGDRVDVKTLVGPNGDAHVFQPSPSDAKSLVNAQLIVTNGLGLEGWLARLIKTAAPKAPVVIATQGIVPINGTGEEKGASDPHAWQAVPNAKIYVTNIRDALIAADPDGRDSYAANAKEYLARLDALDEEVRAAIAKIPAQNRRVITTHDAFGYFAKTYGMEFIAPEGISTEAEASAKDVARIIRQIKAQKIPAVFLENISDPRMMQRIAKESGAKIGNTLFSDALSAPDGPAPTYVDMMHNNISAFDDALIKK